MNSSRSYRVGLNALLLESSQVSYRQAGIHNYLKGILPHLTAAGSSFCYTALVNHSHPSVSPGCRVYRVSRRTASPVIRVAWEQFVQPWVARLERLDLLHSMAFVSPVISGVPTIVTMYDLSFLRVPDCFRSVQRVYLSLFSRISCRRAQRVIAISECTKRDVVAHFGVQNERVDVIYPGISDRFMRASPAAVAEFRERRGLPETFVLYLGTIEPRKNLSLLIQAFDRLRSLGVKLICVGGKGWMYEDVFRTVENLDLNDQVLFPGYVPRDELPLWYSAATAFVYPSNYEGFGIPLLEALACGTPSLASNASSLPEVAGGAAVLFPPDDVNHLAEALSHTLNDASLRVELSEAGPIQAKRFRWSTAGQLTVLSHARALGLSFAGSSDNRRLGERRLGEP